MSEPRQFKEGPQPVKPLSIQQKLHPQRFTEMSGKFAACVGCIVGARYTQPEIAELCVTSDGFVLARTQGDIGYNEFIGTEDEFYQNWRRLLDAAGVTREQRTEAMELYSDCFAVPHGRRTELLKRKPPYRPRWRNYAGVDLSSGRKR